jgi:hypothetical protein
MSRRVSLLEEEEEEVEDGREVLIEIEEEEKREREKSVWIVCVRVDREETGSAASSSTIDHVRRSRSVVAFNGR